MDTMHEGRTVGSMRWLSGLAGVCLSVTGCLGSQDGVATEVQSSALSAGAETVIGLGNGRDLFGYSVALSGDSVAVGAPQMVGGSGGEVRSGSGGATGSGGLHGSVRMFGPSTSVTLTSPTVRLGRVVALDADLAAFGDSSANNGSGAVEIWERTGTTWARQASLAGAPGESFGAAVSISGDTLLVGAPFAQSYRGAAMVFRRNGSSWTKLATLGPGSGVLPAAFGRSVAVHGYSILVGAPDQDGWKGAVYAYKLDGAEVQLVGALPVPDGLAGDWFGGAISVNGRLAVVGAMYKNGRKGAAHVYRRDNAYAYGHAARLVASDGVALDRFGSSVAVFDDVVVVGAEGRSSSRGAAYVFQMQGTPSSWAWKSTVADSRSTYSYAGCSVATDGNRILVGAYGYKLNSGAVFSYPLTRTLGEHCITAAQCSSGFCIDGVCCSTSCNGVCRACDLYGSVGSCRYIAAGKDPETECLAGQTCNGAGSCQ